MENNNERDYPLREGWTLQRHFDTFSGLAGPYYLHNDPGEPGIGFYAEPHHANLAGMVHGGALLTLADMSAWDISRRMTGAGWGVTVTLNSEFVGPGKVGDFIEARGDVIGAGKSLIFVRGLVCANGDTLLSFSSTLKRAKTEPSASPWTLDGT